MDDRPVEVADYLEVLWRWKWLVVLGTLTCALVTGLVTWSLPKTYRLRATIAPGDLTEERRKDVERVVAKVNLPGFMGMPAAPDGRPALTAEFRVPGFLGTPAASDGRPALAAELRKFVVIELGMETSTPADGVRRLTEVGGKIVEELNQILRVQQEQQEANLRLAETQRLFLERLRRVQPLAVPRTEDPAGVLLFVRLSDEIAARERTLADLERTIRLQPPPSTARILTGPEVPTRPLRPRLEVNLGVSLVGGLLASVVLVFLLEHLGQRTRSLRSA